MSSAGNGLTKPDAGENAGLAHKDPFRDKPGEGRRGGAEVGGDEGTGGESVGRERATCVESEPADPEQTGAGEADHEVVRLHRGSRVAEALTEVERADQGRDAAGHVHDGAARKIE